MNKSYMRSLLLSSTRLLISNDGFARELYSCVPEPDDKSSSILPLPPISYHDECLSHLDNIKTKIAKAGLSESEVFLTTDYSSNEINEFSIAYHCVFGFITARSWWYFSSKQFEQDLLDADRNECIISHLIHINSPGGEAYYLDRLSETMRSLTKPVVVLIEQYCASAAYYIGCHSQHIYALTKNDTIGCIGTMITVYDWSKYNEKLGLKIFDVKSNKSPLKNKMYDDLENGNVDEYKSRVLDPLAQQFIDEIRLARPSLASLPDTDPLFEGDTFSSTEAIEKGVIDGIKTFSEAVEEANSLGRQMKQVTSFAFNNL